MVYNPRNGIKAKYVYASFIDAIRNGTSVALTGTQFTGNPLDSFWGAYYGDLILNSVTYSMVDLEFDSTGTTDIWKAAGNAYDTIASEVGLTLTLTTATTSVTDHAGKYVIIKKASGALVYGRIVSNTALGVLTMDSDMNANYGVAAGDTIALLKVPCGLTMTAFQRIDHIATDFTLTPPTTETEETFFLGSSDSLGSQNSHIDTKPPSKFTGSITIRGGISDLLKLKYSTDTTVPTGKTRYNLGSEVTAGYVGFTALWTTEPSNTDDADAVTYGIVCNGITITNVGILDKVSADGYAEATVEFEVEGSKVRVEAITAQSINTAVNI